MPLATFQAKSVAAKCSANYCICCPVKRASVHRATRRALVRATRTLRYLESEIGYCAGRVTTLVNKPNALQIADEISMSCNTKRSTMAQKSSLLFTGCVRTTRAPDIEGKRNIGRWSLPQPSVCVLHVKRVPRGANVNSSTLEHEHFVVQTLGYRRSLQSGLGWELHQGGWHRVYSFELPHDEL